MTKFDRDLCPTCGSNYAKFSCKREDWKNGDCNCNQQNKLWVEYSIANIPREYFSKDFSDYEFKDISKDKKFYKDIKKFVEYIDNVSEMGACLYLHNEVPSTGKSFFAISILKEAHRKNYSINFVPFVKIYNEVLNNRFDIFNKLDKTEFLVIDGVSRKTNTTFLADVKLLTHFEQFLRERHKPIIFTGSATLSNPDYDLLGVIKKVMQNRIYELNIDSDLQYENLNYWDNIKTAKKEQIK